MDWMLMPLKRYADFNGRSCRQEYWMFLLFQILVIVLFGILFGVLVGFGGRPEDNPLFIPLIILFLIAAAGLFIIPSISLTVRRFHDQDKSGWFYLLNFIPSVGGIIVLVFMCIKGTEGPNRFGDDPLGAARLGDVFS